MYISAKYYLNWFSFHTFIMKVLGVNFFWNTVYMHCSLHVYLARAVRVHQARQAGRGVVFSTCPLVHTCLFVRLLTWSFLLYQTCDSDLILTQQVVHEGKGMKRSTLGVYGSHEAEDRSGDMAEASFSTPLGRVADNTDTKTLPLLLMVSLN